MAVGTYSLATLADVKDHMGLTVSGTDTMLEKVIDGVSVMFESYCDRQFISRERTEYHGTDGDTHLFPRHYPITVVSGIYDDIDCDYGSATLVDSDNYVIAGGDMRISLIGGLTFSTNGIKNIKLIYNAGYIRDGAGANLPTDLRQACIEESIRRFKRRKEVDVTGKVASDGSVTYTSLNLLPQTKTVLNKYRKRFVA